MANWTLPIIKDASDNSLMLELPEQLLATLGWNVGDVVQWNINESGTISLTKTSTPDIIDDVRCFMLEHGLVTHTISSDQLIHYSNLIIDCYCKWLTAKNHKNLVLELEMSFNLMWNIISYMFSYGKPCDATDILVHDWYTEEFTITDGGRLLERIILQHNEVDVLSECIKVLSGLHYNIVYGEQPVSFSELWNKGLDWKNSALEYNLDFRQFVSAQ